MDDPTDLHATYADELAALAMQLAHVVQAQALAQPTPANVASFDRIARTVRRTLLLARKLREHPAPSRDLRRTQARCRIIRAVENAINCHAAAPGRPDSPDSLRAELAERLHDPFLEAELDTRAVGDIIDDICRDLGLDNGLRQTPWPRRTPIDIRRLHATAARRPPPLAGPNAIPTDATLTTATLTTAVATGPP